MHEFCSHILGRTGEFSGVAMHMGNFIGTFKGLSGCIASDALFRKLLQSGCCARLRSYDYVLGPCCNLELIGGDGTAIGIPIPNIPKTAKPVWQPTVVEEAQNVWRRNNRSGIILPQAIREKITHTLSKTGSDIERRLSIQTLLSDTEFKSDPTFRDEMGRWATLASSSTQFQLLRMIFMCCMSGESIRSLFPDQLCVAIISCCRGLQSGKACDVLRNFQKNIDSANAGVSPEVVLVFEDQIKRNGKVLDTTMNYFVERGE